MWKRGRIGEPVSSSKSSVPRPKVWRHDVAACDIAPGRGARPTDDAVSPCRTRSACHPTDRDVVGACGFGHTGVRPRPRTPTLPDYQAARPAPPKLALVQALAFRPEPLAKSVRGRGRTPV